MVSTLDFESSDPSSNLGRTFILFPSLIYLFATKLTPWRNGSASDSRSEGCVFESRRGQNLFYIIIFFEKKMFASNEDWTHDLWFTRPTLCHWAIEAFLISSLKILVMVNDIVRMYKCFNWMALTVCQSECTDPLFMFSITTRAQWSRGMILALGARGPGFKSRLSPLFFESFYMNEAKSKYIQLYLLNNQVLPGSTIVAFQTSGRGGRVVKALDC